MNTSIRFLLSILLLTFFYRFPPRPLRFLRYISGAWHNCALFNDSSIKCWGEGGFGSLGYEDYHDIGSGPNQMGNDLAVVNLGTGRSVKSVDGGMGYTCAILDDNSVKCWGWGRARMGAGPNGK